MAGDLNTVMERILSATGEVRAETLETLMEALDNENRDGGEKTLDQWLVEKKVLDQSKATELRERAEQVLEAPAIPGYTMLAKLGEGGMGAVYKARHESMGRDVAIKVMSAHVGSNQDFVDRFYREARSSATLDDPNVVRGYDVGEANGCHYFVMEFVDGKSARDLLDEQDRLELADALCIVRAVAVALQAAAEHNMVHRDIKPDNIMVTNKGVVKLADLGLAKQMDDDSGLTQTGSGFGTPYYMAPEQARNAKHVDARSDIYALGVTLYHLVTGERPFTGETSMEVLLSKEDGKYIPPSRKHRRLRPEVDLLIDRMMTKEPQKRYQNATELIKAIDKLGLAGRELSFMAGAGRARTSVAPSTSPPPGATGTPKRKASRDEWFVHHRDKRGRMVKSRLDTERLRGLIRSGKMDARAEACRDPKGAFRALPTYREFEPLFRAKRAQSRVERRTDREVDPLSDLVANIDREQRRHDTKRKLRDLWFKFTTLALTIGVLGGGGFALWHYLIEPALDDKTAQVQPNQSTAKQPAVPKRGAESRARP